MKRKWLFMLLLAGVTIATSCATLGTDAPEPIPVDYSSLENPDAVYGSIRILSAYKLNDIQVNGHAMVELSGLAWSEDEQILYAVNDRGVVFHLRPEINNGRMTSISVSAAHALKGNDGKAYRYPWRDSEGLHVLRGNNHVTGDDELLVAFEIRPRLEKFDNTGNLIGSIKLPDGLDHRRYYKAWNKSLESVTVHPQHGILVAPELPLTASEPDRLSIYSTGGGQWSVSRDQDRDFSVVALETANDGSLVVLRRKFQLIGAQWEIELARLIFSGSDMAYQAIAMLKSAEGVWLDNFEGLARHRENRYFMVSDDNGNFFQDTMLVYFEILD